MNKSKEIVQLTTVIKRLDIIKMLIALEEQEEIIQHTKKLKGFDGSSELNEIIESLGSRSWSTAVEQIDAFISMQTQVAHFIDPKVAAIKLEVKNLENKIGSLQSEIAEIEKVIHRFVFEHNQHLGPVILKILELRKERIKPSGSNTDNQEKWEEAEREYQEYQSQMEDFDSEEIAVLGDEQKVQLKAVYKKAALMCHPDRVSDELREPAEQIFKELNDAYSRNDLKRVAEIHDDLKKQKFQSRSETVNEYQQLCSVRTSLLSKEKVLVAKLQGIRESETYQTIQRIGDWDTYFEQTKTTLEQELQELKGDESET